MKNLKRVTLALAAAAAIFYATGQPAQASTSPCEDLCYEDYYYCLGIISPPGTCLILLQTCLSRCP